MVHNPPRHRAELLRPGIFPSRPQVIIPANADGKAESSSEAATAEVRIDLLKRLMGLFMLQACHEVVAFSRQSKGQSLQPAVPGIGGHRLPDRRRRSGDADCPPQELLLISCISRLPRETFPDELEGKG